MLLTVLDYRVKRLVPLRMSVALGFPAPLDATSIRLSFCEYIIQDPRNPKRIKKGTVLPIPAGSGWICPVPTSAKPTDRVDFSLVEQSGKRWTVKPFVPDNLWPHVEVRSTDSTPEDG